MEKKIIGWEILMSVLFGFIVGSALVYYFYLRNGDETNLSYILVTAGFLCSFLFCLIYFVMPQPFRDLLLKAKDILSNKDFIYFSFDLSKTKIPTNWIRISSKGENIIQEHLKTSLLELNSEEQEVLKMVSNKKTKYAKFVLFLNVGSWVIYLILFISTWSKNVFVDNKFFLIGGLLLIFLYLRYTYNTCMLLQFNKKLNQIEIAPDMKYRDIRDLY